VVWRSDNGYQDKSDILSVLSWCHREQAEIVAECCKRYRYTVVFCFVTQEKRNICSFLVNKMQETASSVSKSVQNERTGPYRLLVVNR